MSNYTIIEQYYAHFNAKNWSGMLDLVADDIRHEPNQGEARLGKELFRSFLEKMDTAYEESLQDIVLLSNKEENRFACEFTVHGIYKIAEEGLPAAHGQSYILPAGAFLEVKNGKITRITTYYNLPLWIELVSK